jgi:hypothetical protein
MNGLSKASGRSSHIPYSTGALKADLRRVRDAWCLLRKDPDRDSVYGYLAAVFELVAWWSADACAEKRAKKALRLNKIDEFAPDRVDPFAAVIRCTTTAQEVDAKTRSKWAHALGYALMHKSHAEGLKWFMKRIGGINACASARVRSRVARRRRELSGPGVGRLQLASTVTAIKRSNVKRSAPGHRR